MRHHPSERATFQGGSDVTQQGQDPYSGGGGGGPAPGPQPGYGQQPPPAGGQPGAPPAPGQHAPSQPVPGQAPVMEGLQPPVANLISYLLGWLGGLIMFLTQRNPEVRFHAIQSIGISVVVILGYILLAILGIFNAAIGGSAILALILGLIQLVFFIGVFALVIYMAVQGYNQKHVKLPVIGDLAERFSPPSAA